MIAGRLGLKVGALALVLAVTGCKSAQDKANDAAIAQAKQQAAMTGNAQRVATTDRDGDMVTYVMQPPAPGTTTQQMTMTKTRKTVSGGNTTESTTTSSMTVPAAAVGPVVGPVDGTQNAVAAGVASPAAQTGAQTGSVTGPVISPVDVNVPRGTALTIRIHQHISVKHSRAGDRFTGEVVDAVMVGNSVAIPRGTPVNGIVDASHRRGHFKGRSILELRLTSMELNGQKYDLDTRDNVRTKKGKGKRSAAFIGGGAGLGMLVGGVATGGVGLVVGGLVGGGLGTAVGRADGKSGYRYSGGVCDELPASR